MKVRLTRLRKSYGEVHALRDTSLTVPAGEFLTLLGPSGSGKTTLFMMLAGLIVPDAGEVGIDGKDATFEPVFKRDIGMVFQNYALFPHLTVYENIAFPLRMRRMSEAGIREKVERILDIVRLPQVAQRLRCSPARRCGPLPGSRCAAASFGLGGAPAVIMIRPRARPCRSRNDNARRTAPCAHRPR
ncbi:ABC transporter ATP-binding protein [Microvirga sp. M2]|uniref:ABC transporter ATP-binding protein n=1 Tax=Microvirga sp. M2 TaxID=3073270 RepID=UPI0039C052CA